MEIFPYFTKGGDLPGGIILFPGDLSSYNSHVPGTPLFFYVSTNKEIGWRTTGRGDGFRHLITRAPPTRTIPIHNVLLLHLLADTYTRKIPSIVTSTSIRILIVNIAGYDNEKERRMVIIIVLY